MSGAVTRGGAGRNADPRAVGDLLDGIRIVSANDHLMEPPDLFVRAASGRDSDRVPRVVDIDRAPVWMFDGQPLNPPWPAFGSTFTQVAAAPGLNPVDVHADLVPYEELRPGCYDPKARIVDMDTDGVFASATFPFHVGFAGERFLSGGDLDLAARCVRAYNDFVLDEWCGAARDRLIPIVILPFWDAAASAREVERTAARGARGIAFPENPGVIGVPSWHSDSWDPVFAAAEAAAMPLCLHIASSPLTGMSADAPSTVYVNVANVGNMVALIEILSSRVPHRFPRLRFHLTEGAIGWLPYILEKLDYYYYGHGPYVFGSRYDPATPPSSLVPGRVYGNFIEDFFGLRMRDVIGVDQITWQADYPHLDGSWPNSRAWLAQQMADIPWSERRQILETTPCELFRFNLESTIWQRGPFA